SKDGGRRSAAPGRARAWAGRERQRGGNAAGDRLGGRRDPRSRRADHVRAAGPRRRCGALRGKTRRSRPRGALTESKIDAMIAGIARETYPGERRVALIPSVVAAIQKLGLEVVLEAGAGEAAGFPDALYRDKGARIAGSREEVFAAADLILAVRSLAASHSAPAPRLDLVRAQHVLVGFL